MHYKDHYQAKLTRDLQALFSAMPPALPRQTFTDIVRVWRESTAEYRPAKTPLMHIRIPAATATASQATAKADPGFLAAYAHDRDERPLHVLDAVNRTLHWAREHRLPLPSTPTHFYVWVSDRFIWDVKDTPLPIFVYARPRDVPLPLFPDNTFTCFQAQAKYRGPCSDWAQTLADLQASPLCAVPHTDRAPRLYFKGTPTTRYNHHLREQLAALASAPGKSSLPLTVLLDGFQRYEPLEHFCRYAYLLDLPGHYPWSNRTKYLFAMRAPVIHVDVRLHNLRPVYSDAPYVSFIDQIMDRGQDYLALDYTYFRVDKKHAAAFDIPALQDAEFQRFVQELTGLYTRLRADPAALTDMVTRAYNKIRRLTLDRVYQYIYEAILLCNQIRYT